MAQAFRGRGAEAIWLYHFVVQAGVHEPVLDGLVSAIRYDRTYFDKIVASVGPLMEKLTSGKVAELISPDYFDLEDPRPLFDWLQVIRKRGMVYVGLDALSDPTVAAAVGNSMFADLTSVAGRLYEHIKVPAHSSGGGKHFAHVYTAMSRSSSARPSLFPCPVISERHDQTSLRSAPARP